MELKEILQANCQSCDCHIVDTQKKKVDITKDEESYKFGGVLPTKREK